MKIRLLVVSLLALNAGMMSATSAVAGEKHALVVAPIVQIASGSAMVVDLKSHEVIYSRNPDQVRPIASLTKLMTAMVTLDAKQPLDGNTTHHQHHCEDHRKTQKNPLTDRDVHSCGSRLSLTSTPCLTD